MWDVLLTAYEDPAELPIMDAISDAWASFQADEDALANEIGVVAERQDAAAIVADCRALCAALPDFHAGSREWPMPLCTRLLERLQCLPPTIDRELYASGIDVWPQLERLRACVCRPASWAAYDISNDLQFLADALSRDVDMPNRTKPYAIARDRLVETLRTIFAHVPPTRAARKSDIDWLILDILKALKIKAPRRL